jgi:membrane associated rhomboid family serine protease
VEPPIEQLALPPSEYGFSTARRAIACSRDQLVRQCLQAPETPAVWTPDRPELVRPEEVEFLVSAYRTRRLAASESQTTLAGSLLAGLSAIAWLSGAQARSGWIVLCALAGAWLAWALFEAREAERSAGSGFAVAREQHRHSRWLLNRPALLTAGLVALLVGVMVAQIFSPGDPIQLAGLVKSRMWEGEVWRLLTGALLHGGILHLALNVLAIWSLGPLVEAHSGRPMLPIIFVGAALAGSLTSAWLIPESPSVGASGGILGLVGFLFVFGYRRRHALPRGFVGRMGIAIVATGVFGLIGYALVDNAMHLGGLVAGMALALLFPHEAGRMSPHAARVIGTVGDVALAALVIGSAGAIATLIG